MRGPFAIERSGLSRFSRDHARKLVEDQGGNVVGSVSRKTDYVVAGEDFGSKLVKARELGIAVLGEGDFLNLLEAPDERNI